MSQLSPTFVYRLLAAEGILLYVGVTDDIRRRFDEHAAIQPWWRYVVDYTVDEMSSRESALRLEAHWIGQDRPLYNIECSTVPPEKRAEWVCFGPPFTELANFIDPRWAY